jgi:hypothetical protein
MVKTKGKSAPRNNGRQGRQTAAPAPPGHAGTQSYQARACFARVWSGAGPQHSSKWISVLVKRIEVMDQPGENHFAEALAKTLGPTAKDPSARAQMRVALVSRPAWT